MKSWGKLLRQFREDTGYSLLEGAKALGYTGKTYLSNLETGVKGPRADPEFHQKVKLAYNLSREQTMELLKASHPFWGEMFSF